MDVKIKICKGQDILQYIQLTAPTSYDMGDSNEQNATVITLIDPRSKPQRIDITTDWIPIYCTDIGLFAALRLLSDHLCLARSH